MNKKETINEAIDRMSGKINKPSRAKKLNPDKKPRWSASLKEAMGLITARLAEIDKRIIAPQGSIAELEAQIERYEANTRKVLVTMQQQIERVEAMVKTNSDQLVPGPVPGRRYLGDLVHTKNDPIERLINISELVAELLSNRIRLHSHHAINREFTNALVAAKDHYYVNQQVDNTEEES